MKVPRLTISARQRSLVVRAYLRHIAHSNKPIVMGPWRSELGFEVLYWLPFLRWACHTYGIAPERCIALSRGGMGVLYPAAKAVDLFTLRAVDEVRIENQVDYERRKILKQMNVTSWDRDVADEAMLGVTPTASKTALRSLGQFHRSYHLLHPSWMYWLFESVWEEQASLRHVASHAEFSPLPVPELPDGLTLPAKFVAVRFYERHTFPLHEQVQTIVRDMVKGLASKHPVVLLNTPLFVDDHTDLPIEGPNIHVLPKVAPEHNLLLQAAVLARCQAFVGTYGGVAQWALQYRKPSLSFYTHFGGTAQAHRSLSQVLAAQTNTAFEVADLRTVKLWQAVLGPVQAAPEPAPEPVAA